MTKRLVARVTLVKVDSEYVCKVYDTKGKHWEAADYYTDDKADAQATLIVMRKAIEIQNRGTTNGA